jgi:hypothetical protein
MAKIKVSKKVADWINSVDEERVQWKLNKLLYTSSEFGGGQKLTNDASELLKTNSGTFTMNGEITITELARAIEEGFEVIADYKKVTFEEAMIVMARGGIAYRTERNKYNWRLLNGKTFQYKSEPFGEWKELSISSNVVKSDWFIKE